MYKKPKGMKYTDLAKFVDENVYIEPFDNARDSIIYEYLYHIARMLAFKNKAFRNWEDYESFALYFASHVFMRLRNPKQWQYNENGEPVMTKLKSCLNYMKGTYKFRKVDYEQEFFCQTVVKPDAQSEHFNDDYALANKLITCNDKVKFKHCLGDIILTAQEFLKKIPYRYGTAEWKNIYMSCLLTFLNSITLDNKRLRQLSQMKTEHNIDDELVKLSKEDNTILYHLEPSMKDYITVLTRELNKVIAKDLSLTLHSYIPSEANIRDILFSELNCTKLDMED